MSKFPRLRSVGALVATALVISATPAAHVGQAHARWTPMFRNSPHMAWYAQQHDKEGWSCCERSDAHAVYDAYIKHGKWYVPINGLHHEIQPHQILEGRNPTGHAVVWYDGQGDHVTIFCFAPGPLY
jgi:hypothetical protein